MFLSAKTLVQQGIVVTNGKGQPAQSGYDLTVASIKQLAHYGGSISHGKTEVADYYDIHDVGILSTPASLHYHPEQLPCYGRHLPDLPGTPGNPTVPQYAYALKRGVYSVTFEQGCNLPHDVCGWIVHRSSLARIGGLITSGLYDPGFVTENMGAFLHINGGIVVIGVGQRIAQFVASQAEPTECYNGQWQNK